MLNVREEPNSQALIHVFNLLGRAISQQKDCQEKGFTIIIGAGCSLTSGTSNITTSNILRRELEKYTKAPINQELSNYDIYKQFVNYWQKTGDEQRRIALSEYFKDAKPSIGYQQIRLLTEKGLINNIITTNFDLLIDEVMQGLSYTLIDSNCNEIKIGKETPLFKLVKVHGDLQSGNLKFAPIELTKLPLKIEQIIRQLSECPTLVVGYSGQDIGLMQSLSYSKSYNAFWASPRKPESSNNYDNDNIFSWLKSRNSENNLLYGKNYGYFDNLMSELVCFFDENSQPKISNLPINNWQQTTIYRMIRQNSGICLIFHTLIDFCKNIAETEKWLPKFPHYADNYELLIEAYIYFFKENQLPASILQIPSNEVDALLIGISIEILARTSGTNLSSEEFLNKLKQKYESKNSSYQLDKSFWEILEQILSVSNYDMQDNGKTKIALNNAGRVQLSIDRIPTKKIQDLLNTINVLALSLPTTNHSYSGNDSVTLKILLQNHVDKTDILDEKIRITIKDISSKEFNQLVSNYLLRIPNFHATIVNDSLLSSKWIEFVADIHTASRNTEETNEKNDIWGNIKEQSIYKTKTYLSLSSPFTVKGTSTVPLKTDQVIHDFLNQKKNALFILGSSGSGKSTAISDLIKGNSQNSITPIVLSPKSSVSFSNFGINLFFDFLFNSNSYESNGFIIKTINDIAQERESSIVLILDGLNEIEGNFEHLRRHYLELLKLADKLEELSCTYIKLIITCRDSVYARLSEKTTHPDPKSFYSPNLNKEINSFYQIEPLKIDEQELLIDSYFKDKKVGQAFKDLLHENDMLSQKYAHPYLIAVSSSVLSTIEDINGLLFSSDIFRQFALTMFDRIEDIEDRLIAKKVINLFFKESLKIGKLGIKVSRFKVLNNLAATEIKLGERAISCLQDVNILKSVSTNMSYLEFSHDRITEYFLGEYLYDEQIWSSAINTIVINSKFDAIAYGGLKSFFLKYLYEIQSYSLNELCNIWSRLEEIVLFNETDFKKVFSESVLVLDTYQQLIGALIQLQDYIGRELKMSPIDLIIDGIMILAEQRSVTGMKDFVTYIINNYNSKIQLNNNYSKLLLIDAKNEFFIGNGINALEILNKAKTEIVENELLLDKILLLTAIINREIGKKKHATTLLYEVYNNQLEKGAIQRAIQTALELGMALRDDTELDKALLIYEEMWNQIDHFNVHIKARLNQQIATIYKNKLQFKIKSISSQRQYKNIEPSDITKLYDLFSEHNTNAITLSETSNNYEILLSALIEKIETLLLLSKVDNSKINQIGIFINKTEAVISYFPIANRRIDLLRMHAKIAERKGSYNDAINFLNDGKKIAQQYSLAYKNCDCDYHMGFLALRLLEKFADKDHFNLGLKAFNSSIEYYTANVSSNNQYLLNVTKGKDKLIRLANEKKII